MNASRREVLRALAVAGVVGRAQAATPVFAASLHRTLAAAAEAFVPGAVKAGVVDFVAAMLAADNPMQFYGYMNFPMPPLDFYTAALKALDTYAAMKTGKALSALPVAQCRKLLLGLLSPDIAGWTGPPPMLVYLCLRNDATDVVYGDENAYVALDVPYMAHIAPPRPW